MTDESKDLIKRDLLIIKKLHQKTDYSQPDNIRDIYNYLISKELLKTHLGQKYLNRLLSIQEGSTEDKTCIICKAQCEDNPLVCNQCNHKLLNTKQEEVSENQSKISEKSTAAQANTISSSNPPAIEEDTIKEIPETEIQVKKPKKKSAWKIAGTTVLALLLLFYTIGKINDLQDNNASSSSLGTNSSQKEQNNEPELTGEDTDGDTEDIALSSEQNKADANTETDNSLKDNVDDVTITKDGDSGYFDFTEEELMGQIQEALASNQLDLGTKKGYSNIYFVLNGDTASNVVYKIALNEDLKVQTISINILAPVETLDIYSKAVTAAILVCDPTITYNEVNSIIDMIGSQEITTINQINYVAGPLSEDMLSFIITKADIPEETDANNGDDKSNMDSGSEGSIEDNYADTQGYDLSTLLGKTVEEVQKELGPPLDTVDNTEYYSDILSIVYENEVATKIILGLEERFDFTQIEIPVTSYAIDGIHLGDSKESVLVNAKNTSLFYSDGMFYGNTYQITQDGYYVNVDFFTLEDNEKCPIYRIVMTRLIPED